MAHVRRPFYELYEAHKSAVAKETLERIAALYAIEEEIRGRSAEERREVRNARSRPLLESLKQWFEETLGKLVGKIIYSVDRIMVGERSRRPGRSTGDLQSPSR